MLHANQLCQVLDFVHQQLIGRDVRDVTDADNSAGFGDRERTNCRKRARLRSGMNSGYGAFVWIEPPPSISRKNCTFPALGIMRTSAFVRMMDALGPAARDR